MNHTADAATGRWPGILEALGVDPKYLRDRHGPCPICSGKDRFRFDDKGGGMFFCTHCGAGNGFKLLKLLYGWGFREAAAKVDEVLGTVQEFPQREVLSQEQKLKNIRELLQKAHHLTPDSPAGKYLSRRCPGVDLETLRDLRQTSFCKHRSGDFHPALLAIVRGAKGEGLTVHRTYLDKDGFKAKVEPAKMTMPGLPMRGGAIRLGAPGKHLGIAEGIETALCAGSLFGLPVWAALSAAMLEAWEPPAGVEAVTVFGDNDESFTGQRAAFALAFRLRAAGLTVQVQIPDPVGWDWADVAAK